MASPNFFMPEEISLAMTNYRLGGYLLVAIGLLNLRYQTGEPGVIRNSLIILAPGALILILSFIPKTAEMLHSKTAQKISIVIGLAAILFAAIN
jgi:uncharacterized membrane protein